MLYPLAAGTLSETVMDCHPQHVRQAVRLALAHVPREQGVVTLEELFEGSRRRNVALDSGIFHLQLHLDID